MYNWDTSGFATYPAGTLLVYKKGGTIQAEAGKQYDTLKYAPGVVSSQSRPGFPAYNVQSPEPYMSSPGYKINTNQTNNETNQINMNYDIPSYVNGVLVPGNYAPGTPTTISTGSPPPIQPTPQPVQQTTSQTAPQPTTQTQTNQVGMITFQGKQYNLLTPEGMSAYSQAINNPQQAQQPVQQPVQQPQAQPVQQAQQVPQQAPQQGGQFINANGAYFQQTASGLQLVNDPATLQGLMSGQIPSTQGGLGSQQITGFTAPSLIPESARSATPEQGLQYVAQTAPELANSIMSSLGYTGTPEAFDRQYSSIAQTNPLQFVQDIYSQLLQNSGLAGIKTQAENFNTRVEELTNEMNDEIADINDNPWLVEGVRIKRIQRVQEKYEGRITSAMNSAKFMQGLYADGLAEARFLTQQALNIYNDQVDFEQQLYRDALMRAEDRIDAQTKMEFDLAKSSQTSSKTAQASENEITQITNQVLDGFQNLSDLTPSVQQKVKTELYGMGFGSDTPPQWFVEFIQEQRQMSMLPSAIQAEWKKYRDSIMKQKTTSGGISFDDL